MKGYDAFAGVIKSGGKTRRAAKMVILNAEHPDVVEFINCKVEEEKKAWALIDAGYDGSFTGTAYGSVFFQNSNNSVRVTDEFMRAVLDDGEWQTRAVLTGEVMDTYRARDLMRQIAEATWVCGDPGMQFDTTVNDWHTCPNTARINASNPCSEYMFLDDSACNLSSLNLMKFLDEKGEFDVESFRARRARDDHRAGDPRRQRELPDEGHRAQQPRLPAARASGYANLGALLMSRGLPYDSDEGRDYAATITAVMHGESYAQSARIARDHGGPFAGYDANREPFLRVIRKHRAALKDIDRTHVPKELHEAARDIWDECVDLGEQHGFRNAQVTVLAPTGTIGFMMDCDTTGVEPDIALVKYKKLVGGGLMKIVNNTVPMALQKLGYTAQQVKEIVEYIDENETIEGAPHLKDGHLAVFDCAFKPRKGNRSIHYMGHIKMMGAVQPFLSGAISKTVNVPKDATRRGHRAGLHRSVEARREGGVDLPRRQQAHAAAEHLEGPEGDGGRGGGATGAAPHPAQAARRAPRHHAQVRHRRPRGLHHGGPLRGRRTRRDLPRDGEGRARRSRASPTRSRRPSRYALQYGVPLQVLVDKFSHVRFEPSGMTQNPEVRFAKSIVDYVFRWMATKFLSPEAQWNGRRQRPRRLGARRPCGGRSRRRPTPRPTRSTVVAGCRSRRSSTRKTRRRARPAGRSWCAAAPATSARTAARRAGVRKRARQGR